jgi:transcriptional regulator with XRE-family HTH domain
MSTDISDRESAHDIRRVVGKNVRRYRIEAELSQEELAAGMGVEQGYVGRLERGGKNPTIVIIWHAAEALGVRPAVLFRARSQRPKPNRKRTKATKILWEI